jgi:hypothetical protein
MLEQQHNRCGLILPATARKKKGSEPVGAGQNLLLFAIESTGYIAL